MRGGIRFTMFQHTAARRRLLFQFHVFEFDSSVSTHSRPKAAASFLNALRCFYYVSTHSRPKAAAGRNHRTFVKTKRFNTQPPEGGCKSDIEHSGKSGVSTHSRPKAAALINFQLYQKTIVSTHSRPKAAAEY